MYATVQDVKDRWIASQLPPQDSVIVSYLQDASTLIDSDRLIVPPVATRIGTEPALSDRARLVCVRMVLRCLTNPDQVRSGSTVAGPFTDTVTYAAETLSGTVGLTDEDRALLNGRARVIASVLPRTDSGETFGRVNLLSRQVVNAPEPSDDARSESIW